MTNGEKFALKRRLKECYCTDKRRVYEIAEREIDRIPTTEIEDVVKVVRCKDCTYSTHWYGDHQLCTLWSESGIGVFDDGFCNYGKKGD